MYNDVYDDVVLDPPFTINQEHRTYGAPVSIHNGKLSKNASGRYHVRSIVYQLARDLIKLGGFAVCFGYDSTGLGKSRGFNLTDLHILNHGANRFDTLITVEKKVTTALDDFLVSEGVLTNA